MSNRDSRAAYAERRRLLLVLLLGAMVTLVGRAVDLQLLNQDFLQRKARKQYVSLVSLSAYRGKIVDRNGEALAISAPMHSVGVDPQQFEVGPAQRQKLAELLEIDPVLLESVVRPGSKKRFAYLKRHITPESQRKIAALKLTGVIFKREYRRFYPAGEVAAHLIGFTNIDDQGQEGLELAYQDWLDGKKGRKKVLRDGKRNAVADVEKTRDPVPGQELELTIDQRLQYLAYRELKTAFIKHRAHSASLVLLDARNGDVLAMVNQPSYNPNSDKNLNGGRYRNRAITDIFEPGSTMKPFSVACALDQGTLRADAVIDTSPGYYRVGRNRVRDMHNYGELDVTHILQKSSNVGVSKLALEVAPSSFWECFSRLGFGRPPGTGFPGEASGKLLGYEKLSPFLQATLSFGYGLSVSALQLARAYTAFANDGEMLPVRLVKGVAPSEPALRVMTRETAITVRNMLEQVVTREGTAFRASVPGFRVAGKTGTVRKVGAEGYSDRRYVAVFAGLAPASQPRVVMVVLMDEPQGKEYYAGQVAAPVFSKVMGSVLSLLGIQPDQEQFMPVVQVYRDGAFGDYRK